jgi:flagellin
MPVVATNTAANSALRFLNYNSMMSGSSVSKLASGSRIVKASDDAAGLAIGTRLMADVTVLRQSVVNASQGVSVLQVADGGLARIGDVAAAHEGAGSAVAVGCAHGYRARLHRCRVPGAAG